MNMAPSKAPCNGARLRALLRALVALVCSVRAALSASMLNPVCPKAFQPGRPGAFRGAHRARQGCCTLALSTSTLIFADAALQCPGMKIVRHLENSMALAFKALKTLVEECRRMEWERGQGVPFQSLKIDDPPVPFKAWSGLVCFHPAFLIDFAYFQGNVPCAWIQANRVQIQLFHPCQVG